MPTYDYICTSCGNSWEFEQRIVEDPIKECPQCGKSTAKRQISQGAGFILKGGGWYADGYGSAKPSSAESKTEDKGAKSDAKTGAPGAKSEESKKADGASSPAGGSSGSDGGSSPSTPTPSTPTNTKASAA